MYVLLLPWLSNVIQALIRQIFGFCHSWKIMNWQVFLFHNIAAHLAHGCVIRQEDRPFPRNNASLHAFSPHVQVYH